MLSSLLESANMHWNDALLMASILTAFNVVGLAIVGSIIAWIWTAPEPAKVGKIKSIIVYPLKSARGISVKAHTIDARGLAFDRQWMVVDPRGNFLSQRRAPRLALVSVELPTSQDAPLHVSAPGAKPLEVPVVKRGGPAMTVRVWDDRVAAVDQGDAAAAWFASVLGVEGARLVRMADGARRQCSRKYAPRGSLTGLSDGFPLLLASEASLAELNRQLKKRGKKEIPMERFRPNLVVGADHRSSAELAAFAEDGWGRLDVGSGGAALEVVKPCARCKIPTIDQATGVPDQRSSNQPTVPGEAPDLGDDDLDEGGGPAEEAEPTATLRKFRSGKALGYAKPGWKADVFFGQNVIVRKAGTVLQVGDAVTATPRRPRGWFSRGVRGVDYW